MQLLVIRHAHAEDRHPDGDSARALTEEGAERMRDAAAGLTTRVEKIDRLATSPYLRAVQTAEIVARAYGDLTAQECPALRPATSTQRLLVWLEAQPRVETTALVGHEPDLSLLITRLICARQEPIVRMKKGGACLLELPPGFMPGTAILHWLMSPRDLAVPVPRQRAAR